MHERQDIFYLYSSECATFIIDKPFRVQRRVLDVLIVAPFIESYIKMFGSNFYSSEFGSFLTVCLDASVSGA